MKYLLFGIPTGNEWFLVIIILLAAIFWIKTLVDIAYAKFPETITKIFWLLLVFCSGFIGALIYIFFGKKGITSDKSI